MPSVTQTLPRGWSLDTKHWRMLADSDLGCGWKVVPFVEQWRRDPPETSGVYVISGSPPIEGPLSSSWCPLYVGQTQNLRARFADHLGNKTNVRRIRFFSSLRFHFFTVPGDTRRRRIVEQLLLDAFGPAANARRSLGVTVGPEIKGIVKRGLALAKTTSIKKAEST